MKLNSRERAWKNKNKIKKESHPTYARFGKYAGTLEERMKQAKSYPAFSEERYKVEEEFKEQFGRAWYIFQGREMRYNRKKTWIEQYHVEDLRRPRGEGIYKKSV